ncbi:type II toxin-antitoxin system RelE/ParE family toxin [Mycobacterium intracellulare]|uniref:type II toxin-antitoxin system RelE/ParE family toxin n=1 Tax=Mycobacterium intracellulare TaxID=1767 RepID=UPI0018C89313|nr:type II toxin-antitoxin system RelE/ParE family toxin [Mycobacterium intracellulare]
MTLYAVATEEGCEVEAWLASLDDAAQTAFRGRFEHLCDVGHLRSPEYWRQLEHGVFEVKVRTGPGYRLYMVRDEINFLATHGTSKPKKNQVQKEVAKAIKAIEKHRRGEI